LHKKVNPLEEVDKSIMALRNILHSLITGCHANSDKGLEERRTPRRTPIPVKIVLAGENA
jgi:hypothetical protein